MQQLFFWRAAFVVALALVTWLTVTPNPENTESGMALTRWFAELLFGDTAFSDKIAHFGAYGLLGALAFVARLRPFSKRFGAPIALALYGAALEGVQALGAARSAEFGDALANSAGAVAGFAAAMIVFRRFMPARA